MATYGFFKNCLEATKAKYYSYKRPSGKFIQDVKEIRNQLYTAVQYDEITQDEYRELDNEFKRFCPQ